MIALFEWIRHWRYSKQYCYETYFRRQDSRVEGKPGIILADLGMPEGYQPGFYTQFMDHVFNYSLPAFLHPIVLADRGKALIDPLNPLAREPFVPRQLVDMHGSYTNKAGKPYTECEVTWRPPGMKRNPTDHGYFLYKGDGRGGAPDVCQKTGAKVAGWYFGRLIPEGKVAWEYQCDRVYADASAILQERFPDAAIRHAHYMDEPTMRRAVEELIGEGCGTIIYMSFCNPVYSDFEDYAFALPMVHRLVNGRARVICADQPGSQGAMRRAFVEMVSDRLRELPGPASILLILSKHGHPFRKETQDVRGRDYREALERDLRELLAGWNGRWELIWSQDEYADEYWDPKNTRFGTLDAYKKAIREGFDYAIEVPTDFIAENTDLMFFHAIKKFRAFSSYDPDCPVPYPDWDQPLVRTFREGSTTGIYLGCPVGPYRPFVVEAVVGSLSDVLNPATASISTSSSGRQSPPTT